MTDTPAPWLQAPPAHSGEQRAAIIGAGFAGTAMALALGRRDWQVSVVERHAQAAQEASGNPVAVAMHTPARQANQRSQFHEDAFKYFLKQIDYLSDLKADVDFRACGVLSLKGNDKPWPEHPLHSSMPQTEAEARAGQPLSGAALWLPRAGCLSASDLCNAQLAASGAELITGRSVAQLRRNRDDWQLLDANGAHIAAAPVVVIAAGRDAARLAPGLPLHPLRGQLSWLPAEAINQAPDCAVCGEGYVAPTPDGGIVFGASYHPGNCDTELWPADQRDNLTRLHKLLPGIEVDERMIGNRAAIRVGTPDRLPLAGALPDWQHYLRHYDELCWGRRQKTLPAAAYQRGLYVATGFGSRGASSAPLVAEVLADVVTGEAGMQPLSALLHPARSLISGLKRQAEHRTKHFAYQSVIKHFST